MKQELLQKQEKFGIVQGEPQNIMSLVKKTTNAAHCEEQESESLKSFLASWDQSYQQQAEGIPIFDTMLTSQLNTEQVKHFIRLLYHQRAHFDDVLWYMGNFAPDAESKEMIIENIRDEMGKGGRSHESLYLDFAASMGVDLTDELLEEKYYLPFLKEYNHGHLKWFRDHDWSHRLTAFAAIERLDNLDYTNLKNTAESFGVEESKLLFFKVHMYVKHYESLEDSEFSTLWNDKHELVRDVFNFIGKYQIDIWKRISKAVFN